MLIFEVFLLNIHCTILTISGPVQPHSTTHFYRFRPLCLLSDGRFCGKYAHSRLKSLKKSTYVQFIEAAYVLNFFKDVDYAALKKYNCATMCTILSDFPLFSGMQST